MHLRGKCQPKLAIFVQTVVVFNKSSTETLAPTSYMAVSDTHWNIWAQILTLHKIGETLQITIVFRAFKYVAINPISKVPCANIL